MRVAKATSFFVAMFAAVANSQTVLNVRREFNFEREDDVKGGYIAAIVILSILAIILVVLMVALGISNQRHFASKALESDDDNDEDDEEMRNVLEGGEEEEEDIEEDDEGQ